jgi:hypothetical protein
MKTRIVFKKLNNVQNILLNLDVASGTSRLHSFWIIHKKNSEKLFYSLLAFITVNSWRLKEKDI